MPKIEGAELTIYLDDGGQINIDPTPVQLIAMMRSCGFVVHNVRSTDGKTYYGLYSMSDETIEKNVLPKLPKFS